MTSTQLIHHPKTNELLPAHEVESAKRFILEQHAAPTRKAYRSDVKIFQAWCESRGLYAFPASPETVATFLASQAESGVKYATLERRVAAIRYAHTTQHVDTPTKSELVRATLSGIRKTIGVATKQKAPATVDRLQQMIAHCPSTLTGLRDRAILLLGFSGAFRRSELTTLQVKDLNEVEEGLKVTLTKSKTDQEGTGQTIGVYKGYRLKTVEAVKAWLEQANIASGPLFRRIRKNGKLGEEPISTQAIVDIIKHYALKAGLNPQEFAGHSLRSGFLTSAAEAGASIFKMMEVSRHKSVDTLKGYVRHADLFKNHAGAKFL